MFGAPSEGCGGWLQTDDIWLGLDVRGMFFIDSKALKFPTDWVDFLCCIRM